MGSFVGHAIPGAFFIFFGTWWTVRVFMRYFQSLTRSGEPYVNAPTYPLPSRRFPKLNVEALIVMACGGIGIFVEIIAACYMRGRPVGVTNGQHATMYFFFGMAGFICLTVPYFKGALPAIDGDLQFIGLLMAFATEGLLFKFHLYGRDGVDVLVHTLLLYAIYACVIGTGFEMAFRTNMLASLTRSYFTIVQGTWFWQTGFLLYNPWSSKSAEKHSSHENHERYMVITLIFAWHLAVIFLLVLLTGALIGFSYRRQLDHNKVQRESSLTSAPINGYAVMQNAAHEDDDEL